MLLYPNYEIEHFSYFYMKSKSATFLGEAYESSPNRNSVFVAFWPSDVELNVSKKICQVIKFIKHKVTLKHTEIEISQEAVHIFCQVRTVIRIGLDIQLLYIRMNKKSLLPASYFATFNCQVCIW